MYPHTIKKPHTTGKAMHVNVIMRRVRTTIVAVEKE
jgi:hypothetical protein